jgi:uncharacterized iron-regulated membrane protein
MAKTTTKKQLHSTWLQVHKWIGLSLAILIIPISLTGAALVWHDWLDARLDPQRHQPIGPTALPPSAYAAAARVVLSRDDRIATIRFDADQGPVMVTASKPATTAGGRPERTNVWLDPRDARVIDSASASSGPVQVMHVLHGSLMVPGWGRTIVGWVGVFMLISSLTGIWLWWPLSGSFSTGLRWRRRNTLNANLHYLTGFWIMIPLAMLSFTGAWISFPKVFGVFEARPAPSPQARAVAQRAQPLAETATSIDQAVAAANAHATGPLTAITWPTDQKPEWKISYQRPGGPAEVSVADGGAIAEPPKPPQPETLARTMRRWHDGTGMGPVWQVIIFLGGIIPALLSVTGTIIWWRSRRPRAKARDFKRNGSALQAAE